MKVLKLICCIIALLTFASCSGIGYESAYASAYQAAVNKGLSSTKKDSKCYSCDGSGYYIIYTVIGLSKVPCVTCHGSGKAPSFNTQQSVPTGGYSGGYTGGNTGSNSGGTSTGSSHICRVCGGTGEEIYEPYTGSGRSVYCNKCNKTFSHAHSHRMCKTCGGKGRL